MLKFAVAAIAGILCATSAYAADAAMMEAPVYAPVEASGVDIYIQLLGGAEIGTDYTFSDGIDDFTDEVDAGPALAATLGVVVMDGVSLELDALYTHRVWTFDDEASITSLSVMGNLKYTADISDMFSLYGAVGLGYIHYSDICCGSSDSGEFGGFGYQLIGGIGVEVADNITAIGEVRYQNTFGPADYLDTDEPFSLEVPTVSVLAGIKLGF